MPSLEPLTELEKSHARIVYRILADKYGRERAMTSRQIIKEVSNVTGGQVLLNGPRVRKIISFIRVNEYMPDLIASGGSVGYFRSKNRSELIKYFGDRLDSNRKERNIILKQIKSLGIEEYEVSQGVKQIEFK